MNSFSILSFNLDSTSPDSDTRLREFLYRIAELSIDIVCLQECTRYSYETLIREMGILGYKRQMPEIMSSRLTGELIFSKHPFSLVYTQFQLGTDCRGLSIITIDDMNLVVCTAQFDLLPKYRSIQITNMPTILSAYVKRGYNIIFAGDTQILEYQKDIKEPVGWSDAWYESGTDDEKYTVNSQQNFLAPLHSKDRPDRIWFLPSKRNGIACTDFKLVFNEKLDECKLRLSSHYGVYASFSY
jgi:exonuclease III